MKITVVEASTKDISKDVLEKKAQKKIMSITKMFRAIYNMDGKVFDLELQDGTVLRVERTDKDGTFLLSRPDLSIDIPHLICRRPDDDISIIYKPGTKFSEVISMMAYMLGEASPQYLTTGKYLAIIIDAAREWEKDNT